VGGFVLGLKRRHIFKTFAALLCIVGATWLLVTYFVPVPPTTVLTATSLKGGGYEVLGQRYREILARSGVRLELRNTAGSTENIKLLEDAKSGVMISFTQGGISTSELAPNLMSLGRVNYQPFWIFYRGTETLEHVQQLRGKRIAVGAEGSGTQVAAKQIFGLSGVTAANATLSPLGGAPAVKALQDGSVDAVFLAYSPNAPVIKTLLREPNIRLMSIEQTEAITRILPYLVQLKLPQAVIDFEKNIPATDVNLIGTTNAVVVRKDLHPHIVHLLLQALSEEHKKAGLFERAGEFPTAADPDFVVAESAVDFYKNGSSFLYRHLPFWMVTHVQRLLAVSIAAAAIFLPLFNYVPRMFRWFVSERLISMYRRLRTIEEGLQKEITALEVSALEADLEIIDRALNILAVPTRYSNLFFPMKVHINLVRTRLGARRAELRSQLAKIA
jgi:TRAP transporter TAXI family solute receptor